MRVMVVTAFEGLGVSVQRALQTAGFDARVEAREVSTTELRTAEVSDVAEIGKVLAAVRPLLPSVVVADMPADTVELHLGDNRPLTSWNLKIHCDVASFCTILRDEARTLGFDDSSPSIGRQEHNHLDYGGATPFARQVLRWMLGRHGIRITEKRAWGGDDTDLWLYVRDPRLDGSNLQECVAVDVQSDDLGAAMALQAQLRGLGHTQVGVRGLDDEDRPQFRLVGGGYARDGGALAALTTAVRGFLHGHGVDTGRFPLEVSDGDPIAPAQVTLPLEALRQGTLRPTSGSHPERWRVTVHCDDDASAMPLVEALEAAGFRCVDRAPLPASVLGFAVRLGSAIRHEGVAHTLLGLVEQRRGELGASAGWRVSSVEASDSSDPDHVGIDLPSRELDDAGLERRVTLAASRYQLRVRTGHRDDFAMLLARLEAMHWQSFEVEADGGHSDALAQYGGAPVALVEHVADLVRRDAGMPCQTRKEWGDDDQQIWLNLPPRPQATQGAQDGVDLGPFFARGPAAAAARPLLELDQETLRVAEVALPRRRPGPHVALVPSDLLFRHYCLDGRTAETLLLVAEAVALAEPCLLEGETSVSKTSIIQYLASLLRQPLVRLNLNGQTDTGELVGRFLPQETASRLPLPVEELLQVESWLAPESRQLLARARDENRPLSRAEVQQVMARERMSQHPWRWQDGLVVAAMRHGWWVVLDELNLAEPQILERLNPVLERVPSLVLSEHDGEVIGPGGTPIHRDFRIFATMNPAEYAGRSALSPAYRDRWRSYAFVPPPGEADYLAMLRALLDGRQPDVSLRGRSYRGATHDPPMAGLLDVPGIDGFLQALARFHAALEGAVGVSGGQGARLSARRKDRVVFSRRSLLSALDYIAWAIGQGGEDPTMAMRAALVRTYLARVTTAQDQRTVMQLMDAAGIGPTVWRPLASDARRG